jgi:hypothetical protein
MKEYYAGHLSSSSLDKLKNRWQKKHMPGVPDVLNFGVQNGLHVGVQSNGSSVFSDNAGLG